MYPLYLSKSCPACCKGDCADPGIFFIKGTSSTTKKDSFVVAGSSYEYFRGPFQVFGPGYKKVLNVLQKVKKI